MNDNYMTMLDYEMVLENVKIILPHLRSGNLKASVGGGVDIEQNKQFSINVD